MQSLKPRAVTPDSLLVIVPAFNEEAAIAGVVREVHQFVPARRCW